MSETPPDEGLHATVVHPDREFTAEERAHLGLPPEPGDA